MYPRTIVSNERAGIMLHHLVMEHIPEGYTQPGQYVKVTIGEERPAYIVLASSPGEPAEFLIKANPNSLAEQITQCGPGDHLLVSEPQGGGFPMEQVDNRTLVALCNGSGISAIRPIIRGEIAKGLSRPVHLYYGVLSPEHTSFDQERAEWVKAGITVHVVVDPGYKGLWEGEQGYAQNIAQAHGLVRHDVGVVLAGVPPMIEQARILYGSAGCPDSCLLTNF